MDGVTRQEYIGAAGMANTQIKASSRWTHAFALLRDQHHTRTARGARPSHGPIEFAHANAIIRP